MTPSDILKQDPAHVWPFLIYLIDTIIWKLNLEQHVEDAEQLQQ